MNYGKLKDGKIEYAPKSVTIKNKYFSPTPSEWLIQNGYKQIVYNEQPQYKEGYYYEEKWKETRSQIIQTWLERKEPSPKPTESDRVEAIVTYNMMMGNLLDPEEMTK